MLIKIQKYPIWTVTFIKYVASLSEKEADAFLSEVGAKRNKNALQPSDTLKI